MVSSSNFFKPLAYRDFFPGQPPESKIMYARRFGKEFLYKLYPYFLSFFRINRVPPNEELLEKWFTFNEIKPHQVKGFKEVRERYEELVRNFRHRHQFKILLVDSLLSIFVWIHEHPEIQNQGEVLDADCCLDLFKFYLLFNTEYVERLRTASSSTTYLLERTRLQGEAFACNFPHQDLINTNYLQLLTTQFEKAEAMFDFLSDEPMYHQVLAALLRELHCTGKEDYIQKVAPIVHAALFKMEPGFTDLKIQDNDKYQESSLVLDALTVDATDEEFLQQQDFVALRSRPLHKVEEGRYRIIFVPFLLKKVYNSLVFKMSQLAGKDGSLFKGNFLSDFREDFSENVLLYKFADYIYPNDQIKKITGKEFKKNKLEREPDYYMRNSNEVLLFESKDFFINALTKRTAHFRKITDELFNKNRLEKAIIQLSKNIERTITRNIPGDDGLLDVKEITVYPIIVVHDSVYTAPGLNFLVHDRMKPEIAQLRTKYSNSFNFDRLFPVTIVEIDSLIFFKDHFRKGELNLTELIEKYHEQVQFDKTTFRSKREKENHSLQTLDSFSDFLDRERRKRKLPVNADNLIALLLRNGIVPTDGNVETGTNSINTS